MEWDFGMVVTLLFIGAALFAGGVAFGVAMFKTWLESGDSEDQDLWP
jgi:hypothetical protein